MSTPDDNRKIALRWMQEVWNDRRDETVDELMDENAVGHACGGPDFCGRHAFRAFRDPYLEAFKDLKLDVSDTVAEGEHVVVRWRVRGTHTGGQLGFRASRKTVDFWGITWMRFQRGRMVEGWDAWNPPALMKELQAETAPEA